MHEAFDRATRAALAPLARGEPLAPVALSWLVRAYATTGGADIREALEPALALALASALLPAERPNHAEWLALFVAGAAVTDDERIREAALRLAREIAGGWPARGAIDGAMRGVASCVAAASALQGAVELGPAIDELERIVARCYEPGAGLQRDLAGRGDSGRLSDHLAAAAALLAAFDVTARLPYPMLAEELIEFARREWWDAGRGVFTAGLIEQCQAVQVFCRLAMLHGDEEYRAAAVLGGAFDYAAAARRMFDSLAAVPPGSAADAAHLAFAADELISYDRIHRIL